MHLDIFEFECGRDFYALADKSCVLQAIMGCLFCKIAKGETPSYKIYEDDDTLAFLDIKPLTKGHCLLIPKKHYQDIFDIDENSLQKVILLAKSLSNKVTNALKADGIRISQSNRVAAGQDIMHFHLHIIPRYKNDGLSNNPALTAHLPKAGHGELTKIAEEINLII